MKLSQVGKYNIKKLQSYRQRSLYLLIPVTLLLIIGVTLTSQTRNVQSAIEQSVFGTVEKQGTLIKLEKQTTASRQGGPGGASFSAANSTENNYTSTDIDKILAISGVESAQIIAGTPISGVATTDLFTDKKVTLTNLTGLDSSLAGLYTDQDFSYEGGGVIPVIVNASQFTEHYEDWGGQDQITSTVTRGNRMRSTTPSTSDSPEQPQRPGPEKTRAISYNKESLIGKTFTVQAGSLDAIQTFSTSFTESGITFTKLTQEQINQKEADRKAAISPYWNYDQLKTPVEYTFKIVGVLEDGNSFNSATYIPESAAEAIMHDVINKQLNARTATAIPTDDLNQTFTGITYDGLELQNGQGLNFGNGMRVMRIGGNSASDNSSASYQIPGLIIQTDRTTASGENPFDRGDVSGVVTDPDIYKSAIRTGTTMLVKVDSVYNRDNVIHTLNDSGYAYQDTSKLSVISTLKDRLDTATTIFIIAFVILTALIMAGSLTRFVSDSRREIGIFRALGASKNQIRTLFMGQAILYGLVAGVAGIGLGLLATELIASPIKSWFSNFVDSSLKATYPTITTASSTVFNGLNWQGIGLLVLILIIVTISTALFTATSAAKVSPAEAIKRD